MDPKSAKANRQRWAMIKQCLDQEVWSSEKDFRSWCFAQFGTKSQREMTEQQLKVLFIYLRVYLGQIQTDRLTFDVTMPWRASTKQLWQIEQAQKALGWSAQNLNAFILKQLGVMSFPKALSKEAATIIITGLEKVLHHHKKKTS